MTTTFSNKQILQITALCAAMTFVITMIAITITMVMEYQF